MEKKGEQVDESARQMLLDAADALRKCASEVKNLRAQLEIKDASIREYNEKVASLEEKSTSLEKQAAAREIADRMATRGLIAQDDVLSKAASLVHEEDLGACAKAIEMIESGDLKMGKLADDETPKQKEENLDPISALCMRHLGRSG
jgi:hypothetical protein